LTPDTVEVTRMMLFDPFAPVSPRTGAFLAPVDVTIGECHTRSAGHS
jgi:hypothetical protein